MAGNIEETYVKEENKVDVDETFINLDCVKKEPIEEYRITLEYENIIGGTSHFKFEENKDNLIGFVDNDVIMENATIKLEDVKDEFSNNFYCNKCSGIYKSFCLTCSTLLCILHNSVSLPNSKLNNMPTDILEIKETSMGKGVFLLRTLPKNVRFGPFEGISGIKTTEGCSWKISGKKLLSVDYGNWMKDVCTANALFRNLDIFQIDDSLYFQTTREIIEGEELLIYYADNELQKLANSEECLYTPRKEEKIPQIFACTLCCLGFGSDECLMEHKRKCPRLDQTRNIKDFELLECHYCKMWLEKKEYDQHHVSYCLDKHQRMLCGYPEAVDGSGTSVGGTYNRRDTFQQFIIKDEHAIEISKDDKCFFEAVQESNLNMDTLENHTQNTIEKKHKRLNGFLQTNHKRNLEETANTDSHIQQFPCKICPMRYSQRKDLIRHINNAHDGLGTRKYKCASDCSYETYQKHLLNAHVKDIHNGIKAIQCNICVLRFILKSNLDAHVKAKHNKETSKKYKCSECPYQTNDKGVLERHLDVHNGVKSFQCNICMKRFTQKIGLKQHVDRYHTGKRILRECSKETSIKENVTQPVKPFLGNIDMYLGY